MDTVAKYNRFVDLRVTDSIVLCKDAFIWNTVPYDKRGNRWRGKLQTSSSVVPISLMCRLTQSIHNCFGLLPFLLPGGTISRVFLPTLSWSRLLACPNHLSIAFPAPLCYITYLQALLLLAAPTWLWGRCGRHNSPPASSVMDLIFRRSDGSHVSVDTVHPSLLRSSSFSSPRWYHLQNLSSDVVLVSPLDAYVAKPHQSCSPVPLCDVLYLQCLPDVIISHMVC